MKLKLLLSISAFLTFAFVGFEIRADEFLDAVVRFAQPSGSHFAGKSHGNVLGAPDDVTLNIDIPEDLIVAFVDNIVVDGPGDDLFIDEHVNGDSSVNIFGSSDGINYVFFLETDGSESIDLKDYAMKTLKYIRLVGLGNGGTTPGYDLDGAVALNSVDVDFGCPVDFHADSIIEYDRPIGSHNDGQLIEAIFGPPDSISVSIDVPEVMTLGFTGLEVVDGPGPDLFVYEYLNRDSLVNIFGSAGGGKQVLLAQTDRSASIDLADFEMESLRTVTIVGVDNGGTTPGYELDSVVAINFECVDVLVGDVNLDGIVDLLDVGPFVFQLINGLNTPQADADQDGNVCLLDVIPFVELISN